jgi:hypothetical protein
LVTGALYVFAAPAAFFAGFFVAIYSLLLIVIVGETDHNEEQK